MNSGHSEVATNAPAARTASMLALYSTQRNRLKPSTRVTSGFIAMAAHNPHNHKTDRHAHKCELLAEPLLSTGIGLQLDCAILCMLHPATDATLPKTRPSMQLHLLSNEQHAPHAMMLNFYSGRKMRVHTR